MGRAEPRPVRSSRAATGDLRSVGRCDPSGSPRNRSRQSPRTTTTPPPIRNTGTARSQSSAARTHGSVFPFSRTGYLLQVVGQSAPTRSRPLAKTSRIHKKLPFSSVFSPKTVDPYIRPCLRIEMRSHNPRTAVTKKPTNPTTGTPCQSGGIRAWMINALAIIRDANTIEKAMRFVTWSRESRSGSRPS